MRTKCKIKCNIIITYKMNNKWHNYFKLTMLKLITTTTFKDWFGIECFVINNSYCQKLNYKLSHQIVWCDLIYFSYNRAQIIHKILRSINKNLKSIKISQKLIINVMTFLLNLETLYLFFKYLGNSLTDKAKLINQSSLNLRVKPLISFAIAANFT